METTSSVITLNPQTISEKVKTEPEQQALAQALSEFANWRASKTKPAQPIPDELWQQIFALEKFHSPTQLRRFFSLSTRQYESKKTAFYPSTHKTPQSQIEINPTDSSP